jgi:hypothetical protein
MSYSFGYYGAETIVEGDPFTQQSTLRPPQSDRRRFQVVAGTDHIRAIVRVIGGHLKLVHKVDDLSPIPERLAELVRRVA